MESLWSTLAPLQPEDRKRVLWWLMDHADDASEVIQRADVKLMSYGYRKIDVIKALRNMVPGLGLKEAKTMVESAPIVIVSNITINQAHEMQSVLAFAGALTTLSPPATPAPPSSHDSG